MLVLVFALISQVPIQPLTTGYQIGSAYVRPNVFGGYNLYDRGLKVQTRGNYAYGSYSFGPDGPTQRLNNSITAKSISGGKFQGRIHTSHYRSEQSQPRGIRKTR